MSTAAATDGGDAPVTFFAIVADGMVHALAHRAADIPASAQRWIYRPDEDDDFTLAEVLAEVMAMPVQRVEVSSVEDARRVVENMGGRPGMWECLITEHVERAA